MLIISWFGHSLGCQILPSPTSSCTFLGINLGTVIKNLLRLLFALNFELGIVLFVLVLLILENISRFWLRYLLFLFFLCYIFLMPLLLDAYSITYLSQLGDCKVNEGGVNPCYIYGIDMGGLLYGVGVAMWYVFYKLPLCLFSSIAYILILLVRRRLNR